MAGTHRPARGLPRRRNETCACEPWGRVPLAHRRELDENGHNSYSRRNPWPREGGRLGAVGMPPCEQAWGEGGVREETAAGERGAREPPLEPRACQGDPLTAEATQHAMGQESQVSVCCQGNQRSHGQHSLRGSATLNLTQGISAFSLY